MQYVFTETENTAQLHAGLATSSLNWQPTAAKTERAAKSVAWRNQLFQRTIAHIAYITADSKIIPVASRIGGKWVAL